MRFLISLALGVAIPSAAYAEVAITKPWARASILASRPGVAYFTLESDADDRLVGAATPVADEVTLHATEIDAAGVGRMVQIETLDLSAGESVTLTPGYMHLMLMGLSIKLVEGMTFPLTLRFETAGEITIDVPVLGVAAAGPERPAE
ncbi:copper chaperone PCu(A)C [Acuticoccus sediminis]|uniref:copper chaperone PCu(A)C n=1 Tax=Acuticoccus sediminis TaxID=2184697 RepID=UPI001B3BAA2F|nr:copper chaperone PCu(A)C [Acuticoccus sediminis]